MTLLNLVVVLAALAFLMFMAYKGHSVILFAPIAAMLAVILTSPILTAPMYSGLFMDKMAGFIKNNFPLFLMGAIFGKLIEMSGFAKSLVKAIAKLVGAKRAMIAIVLVCGLLTYFGVSLFVVVFAVYPFAAEMFREADIPKRLIPGTIALGAFTFTMDALPGTAQIQNLLPTTFFKTTAYAAPVLGIIGAIFVATMGLLYLERQRKKAEQRGEGYGTDLKNEPTVYAEDDRLPHWAVALTPLLLVGILNWVFTQFIPKWLGAKRTFHGTIVGKVTDITVTTADFKAIWAVVGALIVGSLFIVVAAWKPVSQHFTTGSKDAVGGALLSVMNTASEYGFGGVIAALPGFKVVADGLGAIPNPLVNEAVSINLLAGVTGSASGGMSIALGALSDQFIAHANAAHIPMEVLHRVASMASGGMDTLPHNGAVITLLAVTGLTHKQSYKDIFFLTCMKTVAVFLIIGIYYLGGGHLI